ncbi:abasic site processing protein HMCES [Adelges cooleyi]|uniref:abasic site processing protein HMCES n=1 Tax=Adelges cooleyi TaxID=133065 RepID=UPI00217FF58B|nr:abasic site processing protein HMCES [Adelges cooleyi]
MCGRTACNLKRETYRKATSYKDPNDNSLRKPEWHRLDNGGREFMPSNNIAPTDVTPVLVSGEDFESCESRVLAPMVWGMIPPWHKGKINDHGLTTNNCRVESLTTSKLFQTPLTEGKRCVVVCEGFYEWKSKLPYFIYSPQAKDTLVYDKNIWETALWSEDSGWNGPSLLMLAGLYNKWKSPEGCLVYSYSVITMDSNTMFSQIHHRMPAVLENERVVDDWLDSRRVSVNRAISLLRPVDKLEWHKVSSSVNNSRHKSDDCNKPISKIANKSTTFMNSWLSGNNKKKIDNDEQVETNKKPKF